MRPLATLLLLLAACGGPERPPPPPPEFFVPPELPPSDPRAVQLRGRVLDPNGKPLAKVPVLVIGGGHTGERPLTNAAGEFQVSGLPTTMAGYVAVHVEGFAVAVRDTVRIAERNPDSVTLRLEPEWVLEGRVVAADGVPLAKAKVHVRGDRRLTTPVRKGATWEEVAQIDTLRTDAEGRFRFAGLYPGEFEVTAQWPGVPECTAHIDARAGAERVELRIDPATHGRVLLVGRVLDSASKAPIAGAFVRATALGDLDHSSSALKLDASGRPEATTDAEGAFELLFRPAAQFGLSAGQLGYVTSALLVEAWPAGLHRLDLELDPIPR